MTDGVQRRNMRRRYSNGEIVVVWEPDLCIHSANCIRGLPHVFNPRVRPWVKIDAASTEDLITTVMTCPSGALTFERVETEP